MKAMNNTSKILQCIFFVLFVTFCSSCSEDSSSPLADKPVVDNPSQDNNSSDAKKTTITAVLPEFASSRLALKETNDGKTSSVKISWKESGESFSIVRGGENQTFKQVEGNTFSGVLPEKGEGAYYVFYPANSSVTNEEAIPFDFSQQTGNLDETKTYMSAILKDEKTVTFSHLGTLFKFSLSLPSESGTLQSLTIQGESLIAKGVFNLVTGKMQATDKASQEISIKASNVEQYVYLPPMPEGWELQITATTDNGTYYGTLKDEANTTGTGEFQTPTIALKNSSAGGSYVLKDETVASTSVAGTGTVDDPFLISSAEDLLWLRDRANNGICAIDENENNFYKLTADITIETSTWTPIGNNWAFYGNFNGNEHTISGKMNSAYLETPAPKKESYFGFFGHVMTGTIENLHLNVEVYGGLRNDGKGMTVGGIAGRFDDGTMQNCTVSGRVVGKASTAGLVGSKFHYGEVSKWNPIKIINCHNYAGIAGGDYVGGITATANNYGNDRTVACAEIKSCTNSGIVKGSRYIGGISSNDDEVEDCENKALVMGQGYVGGISGSSYQGTKNCTNSGGISGSGAIGGIIGCGGAENCMNEGDVRGVKNVGGIVGFAEDDILYCNNNGSVEGKEYTGGILGSDEEDSYYMINECKNNGEVKGGNYTGGIAGKHDDDMLNCQNTALVTGLDYTGGIGGHTSSVEECSNTGDVSGIGYVGGIAGCSEDVNKCINKGVVTGGTNEKGYSYTGGILGFMRGHCRSYSIENYGAVKGGASAKISSTGGLIGYCEGLTIWDSINGESGVITPGTGTDVYTGGLVGFAYSLYYCKCCKDGSHYSENGKEQVNGCPGTDGWSEIGSCSDEYCK